MLKFERQRGPMLALGFLAAVVSGVAVGAEDVVRTPLPAKSSRRSGADAARVNPRG